MSKLHTNFSGIICNTYPVYQGHTLELLHYISLLLKAKLSKEIKGFFVPE